MRLSDRIDKAGSEIKPRKNCNEDVITQWLNHRVKGPRFYKILQNMFPRAHGELEGSGLVGWEWERPIIDHMDAIKGYLDFYASFSVATGGVFRVAFEVKSKSAALSEAIRQVKWYKHIAIPGTIDAYVIVSPPPTFVDHIGDALDDIGYIPVPTRLFE